MPEVTLAMEQEVNVSLSYTIRSAPNFVSESIVCPAVINVSIFRTVPSAIWKLLCHKASVNAALWEQEVASEPFARHILSHKVPFLFGRLATADSDTVANAACGFNYFFCCFHPVFPVLKMQSNKNGKTESDIFFVCVFFYTNQCYQHLLIIQKRNCKIYGIWASLNA